MDADCEALLEEDFELREEKEGDVVLVEDGLTLTVRLGETL